MKALFLALALAASGCGAGGARDVVLATTTSFQDSGLLETLTADFHAATGQRVKATAVGTGQALEIGARGDADVVFVHAPELELQYMATQRFARRLLVMHNDFVIVGPPNDPAGVRGRSAFDSLRSIAASGSTFISRGDRSGTDLLEKALWSRIGITPARPWYVEAGVGMGQALVVASEKRGYTLSDRGTFLARRDPLELAILVEKDPPLVNLYHVMTVSADRFPRVNAAGADAFADYLVSERAQRLIASFGLDRSGQPLFFPDAGKRNDEVVP